MSSPPPLPDAGTTASASHVPTMNRSLSYLSSFLSIHPDSKNKSRADPPKSPQRHQRQHTNPFLSLPRNYARPPTPPEKDPPRAHSRTQSAGSSSPSNYSSDSDASDVSAKGSAHPVSETLPLNLTRRLSNTTRTLLVPKRPFRTSNAQSSTPLPTTRSMTSGSESEAPPRRQSTKALSDLGHGGSSAQNTLRSRRGLGTSLGGISLAASAQQMSDPHKHITSSPSPPSTAPIILSDNRGRQRDRHSRDNKLRLKSASEVFPEPTPPPKPPRTPGEAPTPPITSNPSTRPRPVLTVLRPSPHTQSPSPARPTPTDADTPEYTPSHTRFPATTHSASATRPSSNDESITQGNGSDEGQVIEIPASPTFTNGPASASAVGMSSPPSRVSVQPSTPFSPKEITSSLLNQHDDVDAKGGTLDTPASSTSERPPTPPPRALFNIDYNAPPPPRPPRFQTPVSTRPRGDLEAVKQALQLPQSIAAALASNEPTYSTMEELPSIQEPIPKIPQSDAGPDAVFIESTAPTPHGTLRPARSHRREGAFPPSPPSSYSSSSPQSTPSDGAPSPTSTHESGAHSELFPRTQDSHATSISSVHLSPEQQWPSTIRAAMNGHDGKSLGRAIIDDNDYDDARRESPVNHSDNSDSIPTVTVIEPPPRNASLVVNVDKKERYIDDGEKWVKIGFRDNGRRTPSPEQHHQPQQLPLAQAHPHSHSHSRTPSHTLPPIQAPAGQHHPPLTSSRSRSPEAETGRSRKDSTPSPTAKGLRSSLTNGLKRFSSLPRAPSTSSRSANGSSSNGAGTNHPSRTPSPTDGPPVPTNAHGPNHPHGHSRLLSTDGGYAGIGAGGGTIPPPIHIQPSGSDLPPLPIPKRGAKRQKTKTTNPEAMSCQEVHAKKMTVAEKCRVYIQKINELHDCDTGLGDWLIEVRFAHHPNHSVSRSDRIFTPQPRQTSRSSVMSDASFPLRPDASTATDLTQKVVDDTPPIVPPPTLPYPSLAAQRGFPQRSNSILGHTASTATLLGAPSGSNSLSSSPNNRSGLARSISITPSPAAKAAGFFSSLGRKATISRRGTIGSSALSTSPPSDGLLSVMNKNPGPVLNITNSYMRDENAGNGEEGRMNFAAQVTGMSHPSTSPSPPATTTTAPIMSSTGTPYTRPHHLLSNPTSPSGPRPPPTRITRSHTMLASSPNSASFSFLTAATPRYGGSESGHGKIGHGHHPHYQTHHNHQPFSKIDHEPYHRLQSIPSQSHSPDGSSNSSSQTITPSNYLLVGNGKENSKINRHASMYNTPSPSASYHGHGSVSDLCHPHYTAHHLSQPLHRSPTYSAPQSYQPHYAHPHQSQKTQQQVISEMEFNRQLDKLANLVPHADRHVLAGYLRRAGQDVLAIGQYLEDERNHALKSPDWL